MGSSLETTAILDQAKALGPGLSRAEFAAKIGRKIHLASYYGKKIGYVFRDTRGEKSGRFRRGPEITPVLEQSVPEGLTLKQVGSKLGVTRERARQLFAARGIDRGPVAEIRAARKEGGRQAIADRLRPLLAAPNAWKVTWPELARAVGFPGTPPHAGHRLSLLAEEFGLSKPTLRELLKVRLAEGLAWCQVCQDWKAVGLFYKSSARPNGLSSRCIPCHRDALACRR